MKILQISILIVSDVSMYTQRSLFIYGYCYVQVDSMRVSLWSQVVISLLAKLCLWLHKYPSSASIAVPCREMLLSWSIKVEKELVYSTHTDYKPANEIISTKFWRLCTTLSAKFTILYLKLLFEE